jgi:hypothetical protein
MSVKIELQGERPDPTNGRITIIQHCAFALLKGVTGSGLDGVTITIEMPDEKEVVVQITAREFLNAAKLIKLKANIGYDVDNPLSGKNPNGPYQPL